MSTATMTWGSKPLTGKANEDAPPISPISKIAASAMTTKTISPGVAKDGEREGGGESCFEPDEHALEPRANRLAHGRSRSRSVDHSGQIIDPTTKLFG
jgi:hypothetical protein